MRQIIHHHALENSIDNLKASLEEIKAGITEDNYFITLQSKIFDVSEFEKIADKVSLVFKDKDIIGYSTGKGIIDFETVENDIDIIFNIFEDISSGYKIFMVNYSEEYKHASKKDVFVSKQKIDEYCENTLRLQELDAPVKATEFYYASSSYNKEMMETVSKEKYPAMDIVGGVLCDKTIFTADGYLYYKEKSAKKHSIITYGFIGILYYGDNLTTYTKRISGWQPLGRTFKVSKADGRKIVELDGMPAFNIYKKYLNIENDKDFFANSIEFPLMIEQDGHTTLVAINNAYKDGSLELTMEIKEGSIVRLSYGESKTILNSIKENTKELREFNPDIIHVVSCAARDLFWEGLDPSLELESLKTIAPSIGFYSHGEIIKEDDSVLVNSLSIILSGFKEGNGSKNKKIPTIKQSRKVKGKIPLATRLATFIKETSCELEKTNEELEDLNRQLQGFATTDNLTQLGNRFAFNNYIDEVISKDLKNNYSLIMFDVNRLKYINDKFGHEAGDILIKDASNAINSVYGVYGKCFRIGGDEFVAILNCPPTAVSNLDIAFDHYLKSHNKKAVYKVSIAKGCSHIIDTHGIRKSISDWKMEADLNMYRDKAIAHDNQMTKENTDLKQFVSCLVALEESKDSYTAFHSSRVCALSTSIAKTLNLSADILEQITNAAKLHDIGKIGIQDSVLCKAGKLTDEEFDIIKEHPSIGAKVLMESNYTHEFVETVLHHHEKWNGKGYPSGLKGEEIPMGARVIAIADSIDAMTSKRCYRDAMSTDACKKEIERNVGIMYDPTIAKVVLKNWDAIEEIVTSNPKRLI